jgi:hypothetical protein
MVGWLAMALGLCVHERDGATGFGLGRKEAIAGLKGPYYAACGNFIAYVLIWEYIPETKLSDFDCQVDIFGNWRFNRYQFLTNSPFDTPYVIRRETSTRLLVSVCLLILIFAICRCIGHTEERVNIDAGQYR